MYNNFNEPVKIQDVKKGDAKNPMEGYLAANRDAKVGLIWEFIQLLIVNS